MDPLYCLGWFGQRSESDALKFRSKVKLAKAHTVSLGQMEVPALNKACAKKAF